MSSSAIPVSPLAPRDASPLLDVSGVKLATFTTGQRYQGRPDLLLVSLSEGSQVAGVFTRSLCPSAAVDWCRARFDQKDVIRAMLINAGNANAFTGEAGRKSCEVMAGYAGAALDRPSSELLLASTGVIGEPLDANHYRTYLDNINAEDWHCDWRRAAQAIMTTDTFSKALSKSLVLDGQTITISGIAKGSGMIAPDMATMLSFIFTDAPIAKPLLDRALRQAVEVSFNRITVDGDTSTSDTVLLASTGQVKGLEDIVDGDDSRFAVFQEGLNDVCRSLAELIVRDGEGATKLMTCRVRGAETSDDAKAIALSIANSPLVKTAVAGEDANWGRVVMAIGKAGRKADRDRIKIYFGDHLLAEKGQRVQAYDEAAVSRYMQQSALTISVDLGLGNEEAEVLTCDLTHQYISINADYRS